MAKQTETQKRILVTGGAGFIGSHLCAALLKDGHKVICLDNFFTGRKANIAPLLSNKNFTLIEADVTEKIVLSGKLDQIYNLACPASPVAYQHDPVKTVTTNVVGMINVLELAKKTGARVLQASTSEVYGDPLEHPQKESYRGNVNPLGPRACYDEGKRCAETLCMDYHRECKVPVRIVRIFNTYGPNMSPDDGRVVSNFIMQALKNKPITLYGEGQQTRSFQYVDDLVLGMRKMMESKFIGPVNLGNPGEFTILELAEMVKKMIGSESKIVFKKLPEDDPKMRRPDISVAERELNWLPKVTLEEGLVSTIEYFKSLKTK